MVAISYSANARKDLLNIWRWYAAKGGLDLADAIVDRIEQRIVPLDKFPEMGAPRPDIAADARVLVVHRWLILYEFKDGGVRIVRVVDGAGDMRRFSWND